MRSNLRAAALAALSCTVASAAWANAQATASVGNLTFTLYDLNAEDGIAPTFKFGTGIGSPGSTSTSALATQNNDYENGSESLTRAKPFEAHTSGVALTNTQAYGTVLPYAVAAFGQAGAASTSFSASASATSGNTSLGGIELSANTLLVIHADVAVSGSVAASTCTSPYYNYCSGDRATASVSINLNFNNGGDPSSSGNGTFSSGLIGVAYSVGDTNYVYDPVTGGYGYVTTPAVLSFDKTNAVSLVFANNTNLAQSGVLSMSASVYGASQIGTADPLLVPPIPIVPDAAVMTSTLQQIGEVAAGGRVYGMVASVPEPGTWATMGLGLLGLAAVSRRRHRQA